MKYFSGFCLCNESELFKPYLETGEFVVAGFSRGAQKALEFVLNTSERVDKLQLLSPAFFEYSEKLIKLNLDAFKKDKNRYIKNFLKKAGLKEWDYVCDCTLEELKELFEYDWGRIKLLKNIKVEVYLGEYDKISASKKAYEFFKDYADVYFIKKANHFLRS